MEAVGKGDAATVVQERAKWRGENCGSEYRIVGLSTEGSQCPAKSHLPCPHWGASTDHGYPRGFCVQSCTGTRESLLVRSGNRSSQVPPSTSRPGALQN